MGVKSRTEQILKELTDNAKYLDEEQLAALADAILKAKHIFTAGAGRTGVMVCGFTNRLLHLGFSVSMVGEISSPHSSKGDLLIIGSGSGETGSLRVLAEKAAKSGIKIALLTMDAQSSIARMSDITVILPGASPKVKHNGNQIPSIQPMGSAFEQLCLLTLDGLILELMERTGQDSEAMFARHADFE